MTTPTTVEKKLLRIADVLEMSCMSGSTLWRRIKTGQFPAPFKLGVRTPEPCAGCVWKSRSGSPASSEPEVYGCGMVRGFRL